MKTTKVIYHANGENASTYGPLCFAENFKGDLTETTEKFVAWDCDIYTTVSKYKVKEISMPTWFEESDYLEHHIALKYAIGLGGEAVLNFTREEFFRFKDLGEKQKFWFGWVQDRTAKNQFLASLEQQFRAWLRGDSNHGSPLSQKQWEAALRYCPAYQAKGISTSLYYAN